MATFLTVAAITRCLLLTNRASGTGHSPALIARVRDKLAGSLGGDVALESAVVENHPQARAASRAFIEHSEQPAAIVCGGGGGTLRAVIEGAYDAFNSATPAASRILFSALRMGSGNVVAKQFRVPLDPIAGAEAVGKNLAAGRAEPCCVIRCCFGLQGGGSDTRYALTMCGLGQFGRVPGDIERWRKAAGGLRRAIASVVPLESWNNAEYALATLRRFVMVAIRPPLCDSIELVTVCHPEGSASDTTTVPVMAPVSAADMHATPQPPPRMRLLSGVAVNFPIKMLPFDPGTTIREPALSLYLVPLRGRFSGLLALLAGSLARRAYKLRIEGAQPAGIRFLDGRPAEFFMDEDPETAHGWLRIDVAGLISFAPGEAQ